MDDEVQVVFVYGTLLVGGVLHDRWCGDAVTIEPASTNGKLYDLPLGFPALKPGGRDPVYGQVMVFPDLAATLERLDILEGYNPEDPRQSMFLRRVRPVALLDSKQRIHAYCYLWRGPLPDGAVHLPSGMWVPRRSGSGQGTRTSPGTSA
jgi:gamma-glutamylcyclotransferase (GGCT)/AIG2-like uncharacterized protein YtfP